MSATAAQRKLAPRTVNQDTRSKMKPLNRPIIRIMAILWLVSGFGKIFCQAETAAGGGMHSFSQIHMGGPVRLLLQAPDRATAEKAATAAFARVAELEAVFSDYRPDSEIERLARRDPSTFHPVSPDLWTVLDAALELAERTDGAFDVTAGALTRLWREARHRGEPPEAKAIEEARRLTGWKHLALDAETRSVRLARPGLRLDFGGIAKGHAGDEVLRLLRERGLPIALYQAGGDIVAGAPPPGASGWPVRIDGAPKGRILYLAHAALSTSGDAEQHLPTETGRLSHILDPRTGEAVRNSPMETILAPDGLTADSLATALSVLSPATARQLLATHYPEARQLPGAEPPDD